MFLSHSKAEKEKHHFVQQKQPPFPFISDLLGVPTPVRGHLLDSKVISTIKKWKQKIQTKVESKQNSQNPNSWIESESWGRAR